MCCPADPLVKDYLNLIDSFNLEQSVKVPTHEYGHTLDLVLSYGISLGYVNVYDATFSFFFVINNFYFLFFHTQHNRISKIKQNKTADTYLTSQASIKREGERGKDNKNTKSLL